METVTHTTPSQALSWRYATKKFDPSRKIPAQTWNEIENSLLLTPSSYGLQPWKFVVVTDQATKEKLVPASWNQKQPAECSHLVVICRIDEMSEAHVDRYLKHMANVRESEESATAPLRKILVDFISARQKHELEEWMSRQCYIALGNLVSTAAMLGVDNCPMEGFIREEYDTILNLPEKGCRSVVMCALGYRHDEDKYGKINKVRFNKSDMFIHI